MSESKRVAKQVILNKASRRFLRTEKKITQYFAIVLGFTICFSVVSYLVTFSDLLGKRPPSQTIHNQSKTEQERQIHEAELGQTGGLPLINNHGPKEQRASSSNEEQSALNYLLDSRDLDAQEGVWRTSHVVAVMTSLQVILGMIGITVLWITLRQTRLMVSEAQNTSRHAALATKAANKTTLIAQDGESAHLYVRASFKRKGKTKRTKRISDSDTEFSVYLFVENHGATPARNVKCSITVVEPLKKKFPNQVEPIGILGPRGEISLRKIDINIFKALANIQDIDHSIICTIDFVDVFGRVHMGELCIIQFYFRDANRKRISNVKMRDDIAYSDAFKAINPIRETVYDVEIRIQYTTQQDRDRIKAKTGKN